MMQIQRISNWLNRRERQLFLLMSLLHLLPLWTAPWFFTLDGPAHLHNARQLWEMLVNGNSLLSSFYVINGAPDNWLVHGGLMLLQALLGMAFAEKLLLSVYILLFAYGFRRLTSYLGSPVMSWWVFFLLYFYNFYLGQYSFAFSVALFPWMICSWQQWLQNGNKWKLLESSLWLLLLYLTHLVTFGVAGLVAGLMAIGLRTRWSEKIRSLAVLLGIASPGLAFAVWFLVKNAGTGAGDWLSFSDKLGWLLNFRSLIVFNFDKEASIFGALAWALWAELIYLILKNKLKNRMLRVYLLVLATVLVVYFLAPDMAGGGGYIVTRLNILVFILLLATLVLGAPYFRIMRPAWLLAVGLQLYLLQYHIQVSRNLGRDMVEFQSGMAHIQPNSVVITLNHSPHWMHHHLSEAMGFDRPVVNLANYEASNAYFPLRWRYTAENRLIFNYWQPSLQFPSCGPANYPAPSMLRPDYFVRWCYTAAQAPACDREILLLLEREYEQIFVSPQGRLEIFAKK